jgi:hydrogenase expression/formation protein HypE
MKPNSILPAGKLPPELLARLLAQAPCADPRVVIGPGPGLDCAVVRLGDTHLVFKSDPITFAAEEIGWYLVQVNANDIAAAGATPRWMLVTALLPEQATTPELVEAISRQVFHACAELGIAVIGGHTEITCGLDRPILAGTLIGEAAPQKLVTPQGAQPGDRVLLTKGVPIEAVSILGREFEDRLRGKFSAQQIEEARAYLRHPGISVVRDAELAMRSGRVHAMHDPTEGGVASALWELAEASQRSLIINPAAIPVPPLARLLCRHFAINPLAAIASGALLLTAPAEDAANIRRALQTEGIPCAEIGAATDGPAEVRTPQGKLLPRPQRDEIARIMEEMTTGTHNQTK